MVWDVDGNPARPGTQGISDERLLDPPWWKEVAHHGDIYTENTVDNAGRFKTSRSTSACRIPIGPVGRTAWVEPDHRSRRQPFGEGFAAAKAIISRIGFAAKGTAPPYELPHRQDHRISPQPCN